MKFFAFAALFAVASAVPAVVNTGSSAVSRSDDGHGNYAFGYNEDHATGGTFRKEQGGPGYMSGSYGLRDIDGRVRTVNYVADAHGYRASVSTNEPGTDVKQDPAAADFNYGGAVVAAPVLAAAPVIAKAAYAAPIVAAAPYTAAYAAPVVAAKAYAAPIAYGASYSVATQHVSAPAVVAAAPLIAKSYAAPALVGYGAGYNAAYGAGYGYNAYNKHY